MKYTLKDYQYEAAEKTLVNLSRARAMYRQFSSASQFSLAAVTGAGKTVISAGVIEALLFGSDEFGVEPDPGAVVLWFSDDPAINEQSKARIGSAAPSLINRMQTIESDFAFDTLEPGNVYFLNAQKLSRNSRLVRAERNRTSDGLGSLIAPPDTVQRSFYDILGSTMEQEDLTVYMFLDEAHRGMKQHAERTTIVQRLINGYRNAPPIPIVVGISATVERFEETIKNFPNRDKLSSVTVDPSKVQDSGLIKDDIVLHIPSDAGGHFDLVLLREGVAKLRTVSEDWFAYTQAENISPVHPLLVVQVPDKSSNDELASIANTIFEVWPELPDNAIANVFGERQDRKSVV